MSRCSFLCIAVLVAMAIVHVHPAPSMGDDGKMIGYPLGSAYIPQTPSVTGGAVGAFANPAAWSTTDKGEVAFWWNDASVRGGTLDNWGYSAGRHLGFAMQRTIFGAKDQNLSLYDYQLGLAGGNRRIHFGAAYRWASGADEELGRENAWVTGLIVRPGKWGSFGLSGAFASGSDARLGIADFGLRPFGKPWLTLFADYSLRETNRFDGGHWGTGIELRPFSGIHLGIKLRDVPGEDDFAYSLSLGVTLDRMGLHVLPGFTQDGERRLEGGSLLPTTYLVRMDPPHAGLPVRDWLRRMGEPNRYVELDFHDKQLTYQKAKYWDDRRIAWIDLARQLDAIRDDAGVRGAAINLSGFSARMSLAWEFREKIKELQKAGKEVIIYTEEPGFGAYYLASVADRLVMDPRGNILIPGIAAERTYVKGFLDKVGLGIDEWRFMKYKSAFEGFSRKDMSEADKDQIGRALDVIYETFDNDISQSRDWGSGQFDRAVEAEFVFLAEPALEHGLVDDVGRWHDLGDWLDEERNGAVLEKPCYPDVYRSYYDNRWGRPPQISIVYALGECDMDRGIRGRATSEHLRGLAKNDDVAGVVLRADSPGGGVLPSDLVAEGMELIKEDGRPVIVSQGNVAGSGGYWISMPGTRILTTPITITGSIGVIGGWFYDNGISEKTGFTADGVKRGSHSDLFTGISFPLIGRIPRRNLDSGEREMARGLILDLYDGFVADVAAARGMSVTDVREVAQGRIWMGQDAVELGLCDAIGTLPDAVAEAKELAGLDADEEVILAEFPPREMFLFPSLMPKMPGISVISRALAGWFTKDDVSTALETDDYAEVYLRAIAEAEGEPLLMVPPENMPDGWCEP